MMAVGLIAASLLAALGAAHMVVQVNNSLAALYGEHWYIGESFFVNQTNVLVVPLDAAQNGTTVAPVEMAPAASPYPHVNTALTENHWTYEVELVEMSATALGTAGFYELELYENDPDAPADIVSRGTIYIAQQSVNNAAIEGVHAVWDIGAEIHGAPLFILQVRPWTPAVAITYYDIVSTPAVGYPWEGAGQNITGITNPDLWVPAGNALQVNWTHGSEGAPHNLAFYDADNATMIAGPTPTTSTPGMGYSLSLVFSTPGTYFYKCEIHATTQWGYIKVY